jgi:hypothetical protein
MPLAALSPVSYARLPGLLLVRQETAISGNYLSMVTLTLSPPAGPAEPVQSLTIRECWMNEGADPVLPLTPLGGDLQGELLFLVPPGLTRITTVVSGVGVHPGRAVFLALGPHAFGHRGPSSGTRFGPFPMRAGTDDDLRAVARQGWDIEVLRRSPDLQLTLKKSSPPSKVVQIDLPSPGEQHWRLKVRDAPK